MSRDSLILSVCVGRSVDQCRDSQRIVVRKEEIESQFALAGFSILKHYDVLPGYALGSIYIVRKEA